LELKLPQETYMRDGRFNTDAMLALVEEVLEGSAELGFAMTRLSAHVDWVVSGWSGGNDWLKYESRLNQLLPRYPDPVICTYDSNTLGAGMALDVLRTHPIVIIGGVLQENPFFVPPDEFLREVNQRRRRSSTPASRDPH
jgi:DcmR-like sensory protein